MQASNDVDAGGAGSRLSFRVTLVSKAVELLILGIVIGIFSFAISFFWRSYSFKATDLVQWLRVELPLYVPYGWISNSSLPYKMVFVDVGEATCTEWASKYNGLCAALPRIPHDRLSSVFRRLSESEPKLVIVDIDLRSESPSANPFEVDTTNFTNFENDIRSYVKSMTKTAFVIAQPLLRVPKDNNQIQYYDYIAVATILHSLDKTNLRFGQVEQDLQDDSVLRHFPATVRIRIPNSALNPNTADPGRVWHLAIRICELIADRGLCGRDVEGNEGAGDAPTPLRSRCDHQ